MTPITAHPTLVELKKRLRIRLLLEKLRIGLLVAVLGGALFCLGGRLVGYDQWHIAAIAWLMVALTGTAVATLKGWPGNWAAARVADGLGLEERVTSAIYAAEVGYPVSPLLSDEAQRGLARLSPTDYPVIPDSRRWLHLLLAVGALSIAALVPLPILGEGGKQAAEAAAVSATLKSVEELQSRLDPLPKDEPLVQKTEAELELLEKQLEEARSAVEAAKALEETQERLASLAQQEHYAWERALEGLASTWGESGDLGALAKALEERDLEEAEKALAELSAREEQMSSDERQRLQLALQKGANAARDAPSLASALRDAASRMGAKNDGNGEAEDTQEALGDLATTLAEGMRRSVGLQTAQNAMAGLGQARATLGAMPTGAAASGAASGVASGATSGAQQAGVGASSQAGEGNSDLDGGGGGGMGNGSGSGGGENSADSGGSGIGSGSGSGTSSGVGGSGSGAGAAAGAGGGPSPGKPGSADAGSTTAGAGAGIAPSERGSTQYEKIYAPSFIGGEGGPRVQAPGDAAGASGDTVEMPESEVSLGNLLPYNEVYGEYESAARESASRKQLPPALQTLVQRYFSAIKPEE
ncbi:MAG: hypothetical protein ACOX87_03660 [Chloroflexota bacterium]